MGRDGNGRRRYDYRRGAAKLNFSRFTGIQGNRHALGLDRDQTIAYLQEHQPTYMAFENWVIEQIGQIDRARVDAFHTRLLEREHPEAKRADIHAVTGCDTSITKGVLLNHLEDWRYAYDAAIAPRK